MELTVHGSARWAEPTDIKNAGYFGDTGIVVGHVYDDEHVREVRYNGDGHLLTVAPTRSGKGTTQIIPEILDHEGALLCIDPKGENAIITAQAREELHGQKVHLLDPWGIASEYLDRPKARFNPLDMLSPDSRDLADDAMMIADALVTSETGADSHWSNEAKALDMGLIVHLVTSPKEEGQRTLGHLREILSLPPAQFQKIIDDMAENGHPLAQAAANRLNQKSGRELSSVISTAQMNTHFLESENIKESLSASDFNFSDLKSNDKAISVYLVLPAHRLNTHGRWLRLIVSMAITAIVRGGKKPKRSALFLLDEFAALGKLAVVEQAFGLMAGFGMQMHAILQDLSQLQDLYARRWQTFIGNAAVLQFFGTRDLVTAEYASKLAGMATIEEISEKTADQREGGLLRAAKPDFRHMNDRSFSRALIMPEEVLRLSKTLELIFLPSLHPIPARKIPYYKNDTYFDDDGAPLFTPHPDYADLTPEAIPTKWLDEEAMSYPAPEWPGAEDDSA